MYILLIGEVGHRGIRCGLFAEISRSTLVRRREFLIDTVDHAFTYDDKGWRGFRVTAKTAQHKGYDVVVVEILEEVHYCLPVVFVGW